MSGHSINHIRGHCSAHPRQLAYIQLPVRDRPFADVLVRLRQGGKPCLPVDVAVEIMERVKLRFDDAESIDMSGDEMRTILRHLAQEPYIALPAFGWLPKAYACLEIHWAESVDRTCGTVEVEVICQYMSVQP